MPDQPQKVFKGLREHQSDATSAVSQSRDQNIERMIVLMATGSGKSFTQAAVIDDGFKRGEDLSLVLVPSRDLVGQNAETYDAYFSAKGEQKPLLIGVFSPDDETSIEHLDIITTNAEQIAQSITQAKSQNRRAIVVGTYQSTQAVIDAQKITQIPFGTAICDEAHNMASGKNQEEAGLFSKSLENDNIEIGTRVFFTATLRPDGDASTAARTIAMNNPDKFGNIVYELDYSEAVRRGILVQYEPRVVSLEAEDIEAAILAAGDEIIDPQEEGKTPAQRINQLRAYAGVLMAEKAIQDRREQNSHAAMMVMHPNVSMANDFNETLQERLNKVGETIPCLSVNGQELELKQEALRIGKTPNGEMALSVVDMFREGTDMPALNTLMVLRNTQSSIMLMQAVGRVVRQYDQSWGIEETKKPIVYVPIIKDSREPEKSADCSVAANLISAMMRTDKSFREAYQEASADEGRRKIDPALAHGDTSSDVVAQFMKIDTETQQGRMISQQIAEQLKSSDNIGQFERMAGAYEAFVEKNNAQPEPVSQAEMDAQTTDKAKADLKLRADLVAWRREVSIKHAKSTLFPEESRRLYAMKGFAFEEEGKVDPNRLIEHWKKQNDLKVQGTAVLGGMKIATGADTLTKSMYDAAMIYMSGERFDARGTRLTAHKGDKALSQAAERETKQAAQRGELPAWTSAFSSYEEATMRGTLVKRETQGSKREYLALRLAAGQPLFNSSIPIRTNMEMEVPIKGLTMAQFSTLEPYAIGLPITLGLEIKPGAKSANLSENGLRFLDPRTLKEHHQLNKSSQVETVAPRESGLGLNDMAKILRAHARAGRPNISSKTVGEGAIFDPEEMVLAPEPGQPQATFKVVLEAMRQTRIKHATGKLKESNAVVLDKIAGFSWIDPQDLEKKVSTSSGMSGLAAKNTEKLFARLGDLNKGSIMELAQRNDGIGNSLRDLSDINMQRKAAMALISSDPKAHKDLGAVYRQANDVLLNVPKSARKIFDTVDIKPRREQVEEKKAVKKPVRREEVR